MGGYVSEPERLPIAAAKLDEGADKLSQAGTGFGESAAAATRHGEWAIGSSLSTCTSHWSTEAGRITVAEPVHERRFAKSVTLQQIRSCNPRGIPSSG
ncbi:hypothetical protein ACFV1W_32700 [Kitasatospora sp. NPDC059648]|uniref:hypothetical protein n=1 Tax=Kitasatospora sp. NPDC059648 TaxID=3346894 RepID=UPI0036B3280B